MGRSGALHHPSDERQGAMISGEDEAERDLAGLVVPAVGAVDETGDLREPYRLIDATGATVEAVSVFLRDLQAAGRSASTQRS